MENRCLKYIKIKNDHTMHTTMEDNLRVQKSQQIELAINMRRWQNGHCHTDKKFHVGRTVGSGCPCHHFGSSFYSCYQMKRRSSTVLP